VGKSKGSRPIGNLGVDGRELLKVIFKKQNERAFAYFFWPRIGTTGLLLIIRQQIWGRQNAGKDSAPSNYIGR